MLPRGSSNWVNRPVVGGCLLVATPSLADANFARSVVYLLEHDGGGTVGVIINRPSHTPVAQVLPQWHDVITGPQVVFGGGPVQPDGALCLGRISDESVVGQNVRPVVAGVGTVDLDGDVALITTATSELRVFAGHAGWSPGQLEDEIDEGAWWVIDGEPSDVFSDSPRNLWRTVLRRQGPPLSLVSTYPAELGNN